MSLQLSRLRDTKWRDGELCLRVFDSVCSALNSAEPSALLRELMAGKLADSAEHKLARLALGSRKVSQDRYRVMLGIGVTVPSRMAGANDVGFVKMAHLERMREALSALLVSELDASKVRLARSTLSPNAMSKTPLGQWCSFVSETSGQVEEWIELSSGVAGRVCLPRRKELILIEMEVDSRVMCALATSKHLEWRLSLALMRVANQGMGTGQLQVPRIACADTLLNAWWRCDVQAAWSNIAEAVRGSDVINPVVEWSWADDSGRLNCAVLDSGGEVITRVDQEIGLPGWGLAANPEEVMSNAESVLVAESRGVKVQRKVG